MMRLRPPSFWSDPQSSYARFMAALLLPASWLWAGVSGVRRFLARPYVSGIPVYCIGNVTVGGTGKTPAAIAILGIVDAANPCFLTRGYGGSNRAPTLLAKGTGDAATFGDEAVLLARHAPVIVAADRVAGLKLAEASGFNCVIADDGFQNPHFAKTASILLFDGAVGVGNGLCVPAGPCREPLEGAAARAHAAIITGPDKSGIGAHLGALPLFRAAFVPQVKPEPAVRYVAFAGIGRPSKFFATLEEHGYKVVETVSFPDHHPYTQADIDGLEHTAARRGARLITTEKDFVRLPATLRTRIDTLPVVLHIDNLEMMRGILRA